MNENIMNKIYSYSSEETAKFVDSISSRYDIGNIDMERLAHVISCYIDEAVIYGIELGIKEIGKNESDV